MADLDNRQKRSSAIGIDFNWVHLFPNPGTTINANYRQQIGMKYAGTLGASTAGAAVTPYRMLMGVGV